VAEQAIIRILEVGNSEKIQDLVKISFKFKIKKIKVYINKHNNKIQINYKEPHKFKKNQLINFKKINIQSKFKNKNHTKYLEMLNFIYHVKYNKY